MNSVVDSDFRISLKIVAEAIEQFRSTEKRSNNDYADVLNIILKLYSGRHANGLLNKLGVIDSEPSPTLDKAKQHLDLVLNIFKKLGTDEIDPKKRTSLIMTLAGAYETMANYPQAIETYHEVVLLSQSVGDKSTAAEAQLKIGRLYSLKGQWNLARKFLENSMDTCEDKKDNSGKLSAQIEIGKICYRRGEYFKARDVFVEGLKLAKMISDTKNTAEVSNNLGVICSILEDHYCGLMHLKDSLILYQNIKELRGVAEVYNNMGKIYTQLKDYRSASDSFEKSLRICMENSFIHLTAFVYLNKSSFYLDVGDISLASHFDTRAVEILIQVEDPIALAKANRLFGEIFWQGGNYDLSPIFFEESLSLYEKYGVSLGAAICHTEYAFMLHDSGDNEEAFSHLQAAKNIYRRLGLEKHLSTLDKKATPLNFAETLDTRNFKVIYGTAGSAS